MTDLGRRTEAVRRGATHGPAEPAAGRPAAAVPVPRLTTEGQRTAARSAGQHGRGRRHRSRRWGTAARLAAFHALLLVIVLGAVVFLLVRQFTGSYRAVAQRALTSEMAAYVDAVSAAPPADDIQSFTVSYLEGRALPAGTVLVVSLTNGSTVATPGAAGLFSDSRITSWLASPPTKSLSKEITIGGVPNEVLAAPLLVGGAKVGTFLAVTDLSSQEGQRSKVFGLSLAEAGIALLAGAASAYLLLRRLLRTVGRITAAAEEIGSTSLDRRLGDQGSTDEVGDLARTFDSMIDRIDAAMTAQRRLLSDVSHQLRTPLTVARGHLEVLQRTGEIADPQAVDETVELVIDELEHMRSLVERLLLLGRAIEPDFLAPELIDARSFFADIYYACQVLAPRHWSLIPVPDVVLNADAAKLRGAVLNLVDNAVKVTAADDSIELSALYDAAHGTFTFAVEDSGPGIPAAQREAVLARFARPGARDEDGSGLGLAIVRAVAQAHGGHVTVGESRFGGARVAIVLPAAVVHTMSSIPEA